jgi:hypothetical protein
MKPFDFGDWVVNVNSGNVGYVTKAGNYSVSVQWVKNWKGKPLIGWSNEMHHNVDVLPPETQHTEATRQALIDLALATNDRQWFKELCPPQKSDI